MITYWDNLSLTKRYADRNNFFQPSAETPGGVISISAGKTWGQYAAVAFAAEEGRGIHLAKITEGTDVEAES